jgi:hypothetical protein
MSAVDPRHEPAADESDLDPGGPRHPIGTIIGPRPRRSTSSRRPVTGPVQPHRSSLAGLHRLQVDSGGHLSVSVHAGPIDAALLRCLDRVGVQLSSALGGDVGGRISVRLLGRADTVTLEIHTARPGSWTRALHRSSFDHLLSDVSTRVATLGGTVEIREEAFARLRVVIRFDRPTAPVP